MGKYDTSKVRNLGIVAHGGAGKTSLAEAIMFNMGITDRLGRVDDGSSNLDYEPEEVKRQITIGASTCNCEWNGHGLHMLDTPGVSNFLHETRNCMRVVDGAVIVASAVDGVKPQTAKIWEWANEFNVPCIAFVNMMDRERANFSNAVEALEKALDVRTAVVSLPIGAEEDFKGLIDLIAMKARIFKFDQKGTFEETDIPDEYMDEAQSLRLQLMENVAETDDELMEKYLEEENLSEEELLKGLRLGTLSREFVPVLAGSATANIGVRHLLDYVVNCLPSPLDKGPQVGTDPKKNEETERLPQEDAPFSALVFKTITDPYAGKLTMFRVYSGTLKSDSTTYNAKKEANERIGQIFHLEGKHQKPVDVAAPGDIVAIAKLKETATGDTLCAANAPVIFPSPEPLKPVISFALQARSKSDEDKIHTALQRLVDEDPTYQILRDEETHELILSGMGQMHVEVAVDKLKRKFGVEVELKEPKVPYRETIKGKTQLQSKYKKQSGGRGQYGDVWLEIEPMPRGGEFEFVDKIVGGVVPRQYIPAVEKGIVEAMKTGILGGFPVVDVKVTLYDGSHHSVDSSEMAFKIAGSMGFKKGMEKCSPVLLEPIMQMEITVPDDCVGDVIGDMNSRRGKVLGMEPSGSNQAISVQVPMAEVLKYAPELRSMTSDRGMFSMEFSHYEEVPAQFMDKILAELKKEG